VTIGTAVVLAALAASSVASQQQQRQTPAPAHERPSVASAASASSATLQTIAALLDRNDLSGAKAATDAALREHPSDPALHNFAGVIDAQQGAVDAAEAHFQTAIRLAPHAASPYLNLGRLYQERAASDPASARAAAKKALGVYRQLLAVEPANVEGLYQAAFLLAIGGEFAESLALVQRMPGDARWRPQALAVVVADLAGSGDMASASTAAARLASHAQLTSADVVAVLPAFEHVSNDSIAQQLLEALDKRGLASADALQRLGAIHLRHARYAEARQVLERAAGAAGRPTVPLLMDLARAAYKSGDGKGALGYLAHARDLDSHNAPVHFFFAIVCIDLNLGGEAHDSLKKAIALDPENPFINYAMGAVSIQRHDSSEALPYFEKYVQLKPADPRGRFALGAARFYSNQLEAARADLQQAASHPETAAGAHYFLGRIARQLNDLDTARQELAQALQTNPRYADAWAELGLIQTRAEQYADAEQSLAKALAIDSENYAATFNLSTLYSKTKDPRREEQAARLAALQEKRAVQAQEFLRIVEVSPY
jgi:tetratricopeptide (TPR) repeat protein